MFAFALTVIVLWFGLLGFGLWRIGVQFSKVEKSLRMARLDEKEGPIDTSCAR